MILLIILGKISMSCLFRLPILLLLMEKEVKVVNECQIHPCQEPVWGTPPMAKVMRKEARHTQRRNQASGVPLEILEHLPPKPESTYFTALCSHLHIWLYGGLSPTTSLWKRVNLQLQLIIIPGRDRTVSTYKLLWSLFQPHVMVHSLRTVRGMRCSKLSKYRFLWAVKRLIRNCIGEGFFTCWANVCC